MFWEIGGGGGFRCCSYKETCGTEFGGRVASWQAVGGLVVLVGGGSAKPQKVEVRASQG